MRFAASGYIGGGSETAVPLRTPPDTGLRIGFGPGLGGGSSRATIGNGWFGFTVCTFTSTGPDASFAAEFDADGNSGTTAAFLLFLLLPGVGLVSAGLLTGAAGCGFVAAFVGAAPGV